MSERVSPVPVAGEPPARPPHRSWPAASLRTVPGSAPTLWLALATASAYLAGRAVPIAGPAVLGVVAGVALRSRLQPSGDAAAASASSRVGGWCLRVGVALLGLRISLGQLADVGAPTAAVGVVTTVLTLVATLRLGRWLRVPPALTLSIAVGSSICGASAIAAVGSIARTGREEMIYAVGVVSVLGTLAMLALPVVGLTVLGLSDHGAGIWAGASLQEVAQVTGAGTLISAPALQVATVVKLCRVAMLGPVVAWLSVGSAAELSGRSLARGLRLPGFMLAFLALSALATVVAIPEVIRAQGLIVSGVLITAGLVALSAQIQVQRLRAAGWRPLALGVLAALVASGCALAGVMAVG